MNADPINIRFWNWVHGRAEALWCWVWFRRLKPYHDKQRALVMSHEHRAYYYAYSIPPTKQEAELGIIERKVYVSNAN